jgi:hypothetical protein
MHKMHYPNQATSVFIHGILLPSQGLAHQAAAFQSFCLHLCVYIGVLVRGCRRSLFDQG